MTLQRLSRLPRAAVIVLLGFLMTRVAGFMSYPLIALYVTNHRGFGLSELGFLMGLPPAVSLTLSIPCGLLADRHWWAGYDHPVDPGGNARVCVTRERAGCPGLCTLP